MTETAAPKTTPPVSVTAVVGLLVFVEITSGLIQGMTPAITPAIGKQLGIADASLNWISAVQLLSAAICVPIFGRLGDMYGHRKLIRIALAILLVGCVLVAYAPSYELMLVGRALMGPMSALLPLEFGIVRSRLEPARARSAIGLLVGSLTLGASLGILVGGVAQAIIGDIRGTLTIPVIMVALCLVVVTWFVPESTTRAVARIDWAGAGTLSLGLITLLMGISAAGKGLSASTVALLAFSAIMLAAWVWVEMRAEHPMVDVRNLVRPRLLTLYLSSFMLGFALFGSQTAGATFMASDPGKVGYGLGLSALPLALMMMPTGLFAMLGASTMERIGRRIGHLQTLVAGMVLITVGYSLTSVMHGSVVQFFIASAIGAYGTGIALGSIPALIAERVGDTDVAISTGIYNTMKTLGGSVSSAIFAAVLSALLITGTNSPTESGYIAVWVICGAVSLLSVLILLTIGRKNA